MLLTRRFTVLCCIAAVFTFVSFYRLTGPGPSHVFPPLHDGRSRWTNRPQQYPVTSMVSLPPGGATSIQRIQYKFGRDSSEAKKVREMRLQAVKESFVHTWKGYKGHAWMEDELAPLSGGNKTTFGGWAATLVDSLDTLWIMGLHDDFEQAVAAIKYLDFDSPKAEPLNVFETTIRYLGGFLAAYDISDGKYPILLEKAIEVGEMLYAAFDTPNRMPVARWDWRGAALGHPQEAQDTTLLAEIGSLSLEFTRLSQLSKDPKYFDAISRITEQFESQQMKTNLPGMWPLSINARTADFSQGSFFTLGAMADSLYEYFTKEYILLGGRSEQYRRLYERFIDVAKDHLFFRPLTKDNRDTLFSGSLNADSPTERNLNPHCQHLGCFTGGMVAMGAQIFDRPADLAVGRKLMEGCVWAYEMMPSGIMPEVFDVVRCGDAASCTWDEERWFEEIGRMIGEADEADKSLSFEERVRKRIKEERLVPGITNIGDRRYILRPEAIESVFILYRITGDPTLQDTAWTMFQAITKHTRTQFAHAALSDATVSEPPRMDSMESFWTAETLKYFFLVFSEPGFVSLDDYVLNTEAHPFKRPK